MLKRVSATVIVVLNCVFFSKISLEHRETSLRKTAPPLNDVAQLLSAAKNATEHLITQLRRDYGIYYDVLLGDTYMKVFDSPQQERIKRKFQRTILRGDKFVFAVGGHSSAAGHGNYFNESYSAILERAVGPVFEAAGVKFVTRNYGMSSMTSAPELALCIDQLYGIDVDVLVWDAAMTDSQNGGWRQLLYMARAGLNPSFPVIIAMHMDGMHKQNVELLATSGLVVTGMDPTVMKQIKEQVPDMFGLTGEQINATAPFVRNFKCQGQIERGDPYCTQEKFTTGVCPDRRARVKWHPGWKSLALSGNLLALYFSNTLREALRELSTATTALDSKRLLQDVDSIDRRDHERFLAAELPSIPSQYLNLTDTDFLYKSRSLCHTAKQPSEIRRTGILTGVSAEQFDSYYKEGIERSDLQSINNETVNEEVIEGGMRIVYDVKAREICDAPLVIDYPDFFPVLGNETSTFVLPTATEQEAYDFRSPKGFIVVCMVAVIGRGRPPPRNDEIVPRDLENGAVDFVVNGEPVTSIIPFSRDGCFILNSDIGGFWKVDSKGQFEIQISVNPTNASGTLHNLLEISSIIII